MSFRGRSLDDWAKTGDSRFQFDREALQKESIGAGWATFSGKFCTEYAIATTAARMVHIVLHDEKQIMRCQCVGFLLSGWVVISNMTLQTIGDTGPATFLAAARQGVFFIPAVLFLPRILDLWGVILAQPVADILSFITAVPLMLKALSRMKAAAADTGGKTVDNFPQTGYNRDSAKTHDFE